jgi:hypothetical protein
MSIWTYSDTLSDNATVKAAIGFRSCPFCKTGLKKLRTERTEAEIAAGIQQDTDRVCYACKVCGWWAVRREEFTTTNVTARYGKTHQEEIQDRMKNLFGRHRGRHGEPLPHEYRVLGAAASLKNFSVADIDAPVEEIRQWLTGKYQDRFHVHPRKFEETVASVFGHLGYQTCVTAYSGDGGIDVVLDGPDGVVIGVQVKRYKHSIQVDQIRELVGALVLKGMTRGVFVTTSSFQSGAGKVAEEAGKLGYPIELVDAEAFYDALKIAQRKQFKSIYDRDAPFQNAPWLVVESGAHPLFEHQLGQLSRWKDDRII